MNKPPPKELVATRPAVELVEDPAHPSQGPILGRAPRLYSRALHDAIVANIKKGNRPHVAAAMAGLPSNTFYRWMQQGKEGHPHLWEFARDVEQACAIAEGKAVEAIAGPDGSFFADPENAKWWLERSRADGYSKEAATKVNAMLEEFFKRLETNLPPQIFQMVIAAAAGQALPASLLTDGSQEEEAESEQSSGPDS